MPDWIDVAKCGTMLSIAEAEELFVLYEDEQAELIEDELKGEKR